MSGTIELCIRCVEVLTNLSLRIKDGQSLHTEDLCLVNLELMLLRQMAFKLSTDVEGDLIVHETFCGMEES